MPTHGPPATHRDYIRSFVGEHGAELTDDEAEFGRAMDAYKIRTRRRYPSLPEVLSVFKSLGYRKVVNEP